MKPHADRKTQLMNQVPPRAEPMVSVIIPVWNSARTIGPCLRSLYQQSFQDFEIIVVNDGSTDNTSAFLRAHSSRHDITIIDQENRGQGAARNHGLEYARGKYILFLDSDDLVEPCTLEVATQRLERDESDVVVFDWKYLQRNGRYTYRHVTRLFDQENLIGAECERLLEVRSMFTVTAIYRRSFLDQAKIRYLEGGIYEDVPFWTKVATNANRISLIHSPLYSIRVHNASTTKTNHDTDRHARDFVAAVNAAVDDFSPRNRETGYLLYTYFRSRFLLYHQKRVPKEHRTRFRNDFAREISRLDFDIPENRDISTRVLKRAGFFEGRNLWLFSVLTLERTNRVRERVRGLKKKARRIVSLKVPSVAKNRVTGRSGHAIVARGGTGNDRRTDNCVLFLGFDYRYAGNSRYLFEELVATNRYELPIFFVTTDPRVPESQRIEPRSSEHWRSLATAPVVVLESWSPRGSIRRSGQLWIQLWHGTPIKRMLFDSAETEITSRNRSHKRLKFEDARRWTHFVTEGPDSAKLFESAMFVYSNRALPVGYPRVEYLRRNANDLTLRQLLRDKIGIPADKKAVLYAPTWRDYNYGRNESEADHDYIIDMRMLGEMLGDEYVIVYKDHSYLGAHLDHASNVVVVPEHETQELLLACDVLLTDFSSILFDAAAIEMPIVLFVNDFERFIAGRGVYESVWEDLQPFVTHDVIQAATSIRNYELANSVRELGSKYSPYDGSSPSQTLIQLINRRYGAVPRALYVSETANPDPYCLRYAQSYAKDTTTVTLNDSVAAVSPDSELFGFAKQLDSSTLENEISSTHWDWIFVEKGALPHTTFLHDYAPVVLALSVQEGLVDATPVH